MPQTRRAKQAGSAALDRLRASIEAAETALKDLQGEVSRDSRDLLKDIGKTLKATQRNLTRSRRRIAKDIEHIENALVKGKAPSRPAAKQATASARARPPRSKAARAKRTTKRTRRNGRRRNARLPNGPRPNGPQPNAPRQTDRGETDHGQTARQTDYGQSSRRALSPPARRLGPGLAPGSGASRRRGPGLRADAPRPDGDVPVGKPPLGVLYVSDDR